MIGLDTGEQFESTYDLLMGNVGLSKTEGPVQNSYHNDSSANNDLNPVIIRHGDTRYTEESIAHGWSNEPLSADGRKEVEAQQLKDKPDMLITSDLPRTVQTAEILSKNHNIPIAETSDALRTWNIGEYQGRPCKEVDPLLQKFVEKPDAVVPGGESFNQFRDRVVGGVLDLTAKYPDHKLGLVTHSKVQKVLEQAFEGKDYDVAGEAPGAEKTLKLANKAQHDVPANDNFGSIAYPPYDWAVMKQQGSRKPVKYGPEDAKSNQFIGNIGRNADWEKFQREARPSENIEDARTKVDLDPDVVVGKLQDRIDQAINSVLRK